MKKSLPGVRRNCFWMTPDFRAVLLVVHGLEDRPSLIIFKILRFFIHSPRTGLRPLLPPGSGGKGDGERRTPFPGDRCGV